jgi:hypothetical protein
MRALVLAEHDNRSLKPATHATVTAALALGGAVDVLVAGRAPPPPPATRRKSPESRGFWSPTIRPTPKPWPSRWPICWSASPPGTTPCSPPPPPAART